MIKTEKKSVPMHKATQGFVDVHIKKCMTSLRRKIIRFNKFGVSGINANPIQTLTILKTIEFFCRRHYRAISCPRKFDVHNKYWPENVVRGLNIKFPTEPNTHRAKERRTIVFIVQR